MAYIVRLSETVRHELAAIADWYRTNASDDAVGDEWYSGMMAALNGLASNPEFWSIARESHRFPMELRELHYASGKRITHRAVFEICGQEVRVHAIRHAAQDDLTTDALNVNW